MQPIPNTAPERRITTTFCWALCLAVLLAHAVVATVNLSSLLREAHLAYELFPLPHYGYLPVRQNPIPEEPPHKPVYSLGADFSAVYLSAQAIRHGDSPYEPRHAEWRDQFGRRPNYPPLTHHLYLALTGLTYPNAVWLHMATTLLLFLGLSAWVLWEMGLSRLILPFVTVTLLLGHETPIGFTHFERGQFDFLVASAFLLTCACLIVPRRVWAMTVAAGFLAGLKWTSFPFLGCFGLSAGLVTTARHRRLALLAIPGMIILGLALFPSELLEYLPGVWHYEAADKPSVLSLARVLPPLLAKSAIVILTCVFLAAFVFRVRQGADQNMAVAASLPPFALSLAIVGLLFGTWAFEYRVVSLLGLVPFVLHWVERATVVPLRLRGAVAVLLGFFLLIAFRVLEVESAITESAMRSIYLTASLVFLVISVGVLFLLPHRSAQS